MRKILLLLIYALLCVSLVACRKEPVEPHPSVPETTEAHLDAYLPTYPKPAVAAPGEDSSQNLQTELYEPYGEPVTCPGILAPENVTYSCHIPETRYSQEGTRARYDETEAGIRILMGKTEVALLTDDLTAAAEEICLPLLAEDYDTLAPSTRTEHAAQAEACETVTIGGREMVKMRARMTYSNEGVTEKVRMIVYVCQLSNGNCAYWSAGYIEGEMFLEVKNTALNMAKTFTEFNYDPE